MDKILFAVKFLVSVVLAVLTLPVFLIGAIVGGCTAIFTMGWDAATDLAERLADALDHLMEN